MLQIPHRVNSVGEFTSDEMFFKALKRFRFVVLKPASRSLAARSCFFSFFDFANARSSRLSRDVDRERDRERSPHGEWERERGISVDARRNES